MKYHGCPILELLPLTIWPLCVFITLLIICFFIFRPLRKKGNKTAKILTVILPILGWSIWHFYPSLTVQGTYFAKVPYVNAEDTSTIVITDKFQWQDMTPVDYEVDPVFRVIWLSSKQDKFQFGAKLGWNSITYYILKTGMVKHQKQRANQQVDPIVTTPVDEVEAQSTQGHP